MWANAGTPDGQWLIGSSGSQGFPSSTSAGDAVLYSVKDQTVRVMAGLGGPGTQMLSAAADERWVVWSEASDAPFFYAWRLMAFDRDSGHVREVAAAVRNASGAVQGPYPAPSISHGQMVWGQAIAPVTGTDTIGNAVVKEADLASDTILTRATSAGMPVISWPWLAWDVSTDAGGYVELENSVSGQAAKLEMTPPTFALDGDSAAYNDPNSQHVYLVENLNNATRGKLIAQAGSDAEHLEWITLNDRIVAWSHTTLTEVYDRKLSEIVELPMHSGRSAVYVCGPLVVWGDTDPGRPTNGLATRLVMLDSTNLP